MPFDPCAAYPRASVAASLEACARASRLEQLDHSDLALPASHVSPRLTTAEALAERLAFAERDRRPSAQLAWHVWDAGTPAHTDWRVTFVRSDGGQTTYPTEARRS